MEFLSGPRDVSTSVIGIRASNMEKVSTFHLVAVGEKASGSRANLFIGSSMTLGRTECT